MTSFHYTTERELREEVVRNIGEGKIIKTVTIDKGHPAGPELHILSDTGIITIKNARTKKMITKLIARPGQIKRYYNNNETIPQGLIELAIQHQRMGLNYC